MASSQEILNSLKNIIDPDFNKDIVTLGFVQNIQVKGGEVSFDIVLTTPACPIKDEFKKKAEDLVSKISGVTKVNVNMTAQQMTKPQNIASPQNTLHNIGAIIAVSSCKGGVGKSTIAAYLAQEIARRGYTVGLLDADVHGPSVPTLFNLDKERIKVDAEGKFIPIHKNGLKIMSFGFLIGDAPAVMRGPIVTRYIQQLLLNTNWGKLDYLFIDMPPGTGDVQLTITQTIRLDGAVIITTRQTLSLVDVSRGIFMFEKVNVPILGIIENMSYFICDQCNKKHYIFGAPGTNTLKERFGVETLAELPILQQLTHKIAEPLVNDYIMTMTDQVVRALGKSSIDQKSPPKISFDHKEVTLEFTGGEIYKISHRDLRLSCRCALCINELTGQKTLKEESIRQDIAPKEIFPLGNYAIAVNWNDGHSSGIYPYETITSKASPAHRSGPIPS